MTEKEKRLMHLLKGFPHPNHIGDDYMGINISILSAARKYGWTDEFIRICEENQGLAFDKILSLIFTDERFPPIPVVDDDEMPDEWKNSAIE